MLWHAYNFGGTVQTGTIFGICTPKLVRMKFWISFSRSDAVSSVQAFKHFSDFSFIRKTFNYKCHLGETLKLKYELFLGLRWCDFRTQRVSLLFHGGVDPPGDVGHGLRHYVGFPFDLRSDWWIQWRLLLMHRKSEVWAMDSRFLPERTNMQWHHEPVWSHQ